MELVIGCDINEYYVQFSYAEEGKEPVMPDFPVSHRLRQHFADGKV